jgi:NAD(P)-dependent dehydrogenase (short-subunit alcohol dehydrogenase family)
MSAPSFDLTDRVAVVTGGYGVLGGAIAAGLATAGARVVVLGRRRDVAEAHVAELRRQGAQAMAVVADALDDAAVRRARDEVLAAWGAVDVLVNAAGGNVARARNDARSIFEVPLDAFEEALRLNLHGTVIPTLAFAEAMAARGRGSIINISSMAALRVISGVLAYSIAKTGVDAFTRWMAVEMACKHGDGLRVNAIAPGFFLSEQNRAVLVEADGTLTPRARTIVRQTPMGRFGRPEELLGAVQWLASDASSFVTGVVLPVDGGFSVNGGV